MALLTVHGLPALAQVQMSEKSVLQRPEHGLKDENSHDRMLAETQDRRASTALMASHFQPADSARDQYLPRFEIRHDDRDKPAVFRNAETDKVAERATDKPGEIPEKVREIHNLRHSVHNGRNADAMVVLPKDFDASKPVNVTIYNHGWYDTASSAVRNARLTEQMRSAPPNTVLVVPEWQVRPGSHGPGANFQGRYAGENFAQNQLQEIFNRTPELKNTKLGDIQNINIISHSAGINPTESALYRNPELAKKVNSVTLLDSLYDGPGLNNWIKANIGDLASGRKRFHNIFNESTDGNSRVQAKFVADELARYSGGRDRSARLIDLSNRPLTVEQLRDYPIVFKSTKVTHMEIPKHMVETVQQAAALRKRGR